MLSTHSGREYDFPFRFPVGAIPLGAAFVKVPKFSIEGNVQADVLDSAVFREP